MGGPADIVSEVSATDSEPHHVRRTPAFLAKHKKSSDVCAAQYCRRECDVIVVGTPLCAGHYAAHLDEAYARAR